MPLYHVRVEYDYWAEANNKSDATILARDAARDLHLFDYAKAEEIDDIKYAPRDKDTLSTLVYGPDEDITVKEVLSRLPNTLDTPTAVVAPVSTDSP